MGRKRGPWGTVTSDQGSILDESNTRDKSEREENTNRNQPEVPRVKKVKLGREQGKWDQNTIPDLAGQGIDTGEWKHTRVWKFLRPQMCQEEQDFHRAQDLTDETARLLVVTASKSSTSAGKSGTTDNNADARTDNTRWHTPLR